MSEAFRETEGRESQSLVFLYEGFIRMTRHFGQDSRIVAEAAEYSWDHFMDMMAVGIPPEKPLPYLLRVCRHKAMVLSKGKRVVSANLDQLVENSEEIYQERRKISACELEAQRNQLRKLENEFVDSLTPCQKKIYDLVSLGMSSNKISNELGWTTSNVRRAVKNLGKKIRKLLPPPPLRLVKAIENKRIKQKG